MSVPLIVIIAVSLALLLWVALLYNRLVTARQRVNEAWSGIDVQLKRRASLIPNLVQTVKGYARHEADLLEQLAAQRHAGRDPEARAREEGQISQALVGVFSAAEAWPELRASENFQGLQQALESSERDIQHARRYYNGAVRVMNVAVQSFPSNLLAGRFGFGEALFFEPEDPVAARRLPEVAF